MLAQNDVNFSLEYLWIEAITADRRPPVLADNIEPLMSERPHGVFTRQVLLGDNLDTSKIVAQYTEGVVTLAIPVAEEAKSRRIDVRHESSTTEIAPQSQVPVWLAAGTSAGHTGADEYIFHAHRIEFLVSWPSIWRCWWDLVPSGARKLTAGSSQFASALAVTLRSSEM